MKNLLKKLFMLVLTIMAIAGSTQLEAWSRYGSGSDGYQSSNPRFGHRHYWRHYYHPWRRYYWYRPHWYHRHYYW